MSDELVRKVIQVISSTQKLPPGRVTVDSTFEELGIDSMDGVNILFGLENEFDINIPDEQAKGIRTVRQMAEGVDRLVAIKTSGKPADR